MREHIRAGLDELSKHGIKGRVEVGGRHPRLVFEHDGRRTALVVAFSPRNNHVASRRVQADVRKALGVRA